MKNIIVSVLINIALFVLSFGLYTVVAFWMGLGSNDEYASYAWGLFYFFAFTQLLVFTLIARKKIGLRTAYYFTGVLTILIVYTSVVYCYSA